MSSGDAQQVYDEGVAKARSKIEGAMESMVEAIDIFKVSGPQQRELEQAFVGHMFAFLRLLEQARYARWSA